MTKGNTTLIQKDPRKETALNNNRPITSLTMIWKILTAQVREEIYSSLRSRGFFPRNRKDAAKDQEPQQSYFTSDVKNLALAWIDYKKAYDMVLLSSIINCLKMYIMSHEDTTFIEKTMKNWRVELPAGGRRLSEAKIQRSIFQGDALSPLQFIIVRMPLNHIPRKRPAGYLVDC